MSAQGEWRLLSVGEVIAEGDEYLRWRHTEWKPLGDGWRGLTVRPDDRPIRRRIAPAPTEGAEPALLRELRGLRNSWIQVRDEYEVGDRYRRAMEGCIYNLEEVLAVALSRATGGTK